MRVHRSLFSLLQAHFPASGAAHIGWVMIRAADPAAPKHASAIQSLRSEASDADVDTMIAAARKSASSPRASDVDGWSTMTERILEALEEERERRLSPERRAAIASATDRRFARFEELKASGVPHNNAMDQALAEIP